MHTAVHVIHVLDYMLCGRLNERLSDYYINREAVLVKKNMRKCFLNHVKNKHFHLFSFYAFMVGQMLFSVKFSKRIFCYYL